MNFESVDPETNAPNWGCPRLSEHGAGWLIGMMPTANPGAVAAMQAEVAAWLKTFS